MKKTLSLLLAFAMLLTLAPAGAFAADPITYKDYLIERYELAHAQSVLSDVADVTEENGALKIVLTSDINGRLHIGTDSWEDWDGDFVLDLNGHKIETDNTFGEALCLDNSFEGNLTITGSGTIKGGEHQIVYVGLGELRFALADGYEYFTVKVDVITAIGAPPVTVTGITYFDKKVILYGSEGSAKIYSSDFVGDDPDEQLPVSANLPKAVVQTVDPIVLAYELKRHPVKCCCRKIPRCVESRAGVSGIGNGDNDSTLFVTLGLFTVVQLIRNVQMLVPVYDFCIPQKECTTTCDSPCDRFSKIKFPTSEFFPPTELSDGTDSGCTACD